MNKTPQDFARFMAWAENHLGQGYSLKMDDHTFEDKVTRWAFNAYSAAYNSQQAIIDRLMLEFCPGEMTQEQIDEWAKHQKPYTGESE